MAECGGRISGSFQVTMKLPPINLAHLEALTDHVGIIQHAKHSVADRKTGYTADDNARALIVAAKHHELYNDDLSKKLATTYMSFLYHLQKEDGRVHNLMEYGSSLLDEVGSEDSFGRTIWACGYVMSSKLPDSFKATSKHVFDNALKWVRDLESPRARAFSIVGLYHYNKGCPENTDALARTEYLSKRMLENYRDESDDTWKWFEPVIAYSNGKIPQALFLAYEMTGNKEYLEVAEESLDFLTRATIIDGMLVPIGHDGWYKKSGKRAHYDQQPVNVEAKIEAYLTAYRVTGKKDYYDKALLSFEWFHGKNSIGKPLYNPENGGCFDGLMPMGVNANQGAESTVSYLLARLLMEENKQP